MLYLRPTYNNMVTDIIRSGDTRLRHVLRFWHHLTATMLLPLSECFSVDGSQLQLYLAVQCGEFGFQLFQLVLLFPCLPGYLLQLRDFTLQRGDLFLVLVDDARYPFQCVQEIRAAACVSAIARCPLL